MRFSTTTGEVYDIPDMCSHCSLDTAGNHEGNCPCRGRNESLQMACTFFPSPPLNPLTHDTPYPFEKGKIYCEECLKFGRIREVPCKVHRKEATEMGINREGETGNTTERLGRIEKCLIEIARRIDVIEDPACYSSEAEERIKEILGKEEK